MTDKKDTSNEYGGSYFGPNGYQEMLPNGRLPKPIILSSEGKMASRLSGVLHSEKRPLDEIPGYEDLFEMQKKLLGFFDEDWFYYKGIVRFKTRGFKIIGITETERKEKALA